MKPTQRQLDFITELIQNMTLAATSVTLSGLLLLIPLHNTKNTWLKTLYGSAGFATVGLSAALLESKRQYYVKVRRAYVDVNDQIEVQKSWENRNEKVLPPSQSPEGFTDAELPDGLGFIMWDDFVSTYINNPLDKPHFNVIGSTGDGKSLTAEIIGDLRADYYKSQKTQPRTVYLSPTVELHEFLGWECIGNGFKQREIESFGEYLAYTLIHRYTDNEAETTPVVVVNDEYRWSSRRTDLPEVINDTLAMGRKKYLNIITTNVTNLVASQGMSGEGDLRKNYTTILKGESALEHIKVQENEGLLPEGSFEYCEALFKNHRYRFSFIQNIQKVMMLPDLSLYRSYKVNRGFSYKPAEQVVLPKPPAEPDNATTPKKRTNKYRT